MGMYMLADKDDDYVDGPFVDESAAEEALSDYESAGRETHDGVHVARMSDRLLDTMLYGIEA